ncbi:hypothetical protein GCM10010400_21690 [Streptomyces aculeolatus]
MSTTETTVSTKSVIEAAVHSTVSARARTPASAQFRKIISVFPSVPAVSAGPCWSRVRSAAVPCPACGRGPARAAVRRAHVTVCRVGRAGARGRPPGAGV